MVKKCILAVALALLAGVGMSTATMPAFAAEADAPQIISDIVEVEVNGATEFIFTPEATGYWSFRTSDNGGSDPYLWIRNMYGMLIASDDDGGDGLNSHIVVHLVEGADYIVEAGFFWGTAGSYTLTVYMVDRFVPPVPTWQRSAPSLPAPPLSLGAGTFTLGSSQNELFFTPDTTGLWTFEAYPIQYMFIGDPLSNTIAWLDLWDSRQDGGTITVYLVAGVQYLIDVSSWWGEEYTLSISLADEFVPWMPVDEMAAMGFVMEIDEYAPQLPGEGGTLTVQNVSQFSFVPDSTGPWVVDLQAANRNADVILLLSDTYLSFFGVDDGWGRHDFAMYLAEGVTYTIWIFEEERWSRVQPYTGSVTITISPLDPETFNEAGDWDWESMLAEWDVEWDAEWGIAWEPRADTDTAMVDTLEMTIPPAGGRVEATQLSSFFTFTPNNTGTWTIQSSANMSFFGIADESGSFWLEADQSGVITINLAAGVEYTIFAFPIGSASVGELFVTPYHEIQYFDATGAATRHVHRETEFTFVPDETGLWVIRTHDNGNSDPYLWLLDAGGNVLAEDDDGSDGLNAIIKIELTAGTVYTIRAGFFADSAGRYQLTVSRLDVNGQALERLPSPRVNG